MASHRAGQLPRSAARRSASIALLTLRQRSGAAVIPDWDAKLLRLVGEVRRDARAGEYDHTDREDLEDPVVCLNGAALACRFQSGLKTTCVTLWLSAQQAAMRSAPLGLPPCSNTISGCLPRTLSSVAQSPRRKQEER